MGTEELGISLAAARAARGWSLQAVGEAAKLSPAYLHKLEAGRVGSPNPRLLARLATALGLSYRRLMALAGYLSGDAEEDVDASSGTPVGDAAPARPAPVGRGLVGPGSVGPGPAGSAPPGSAPPDSAPTNAELLAALVDLRRLLGDVRAEQARLADEVARLAAR
ncbi:helix-turn-helix domain-containing protein [Geodermatophilus sp. YIM 151500]|uniref:helix-turn-helix domain-containing protein n=1 Tax=Geodermatophilus sp. YIM 151500 TaxID=2984531 RepID=UPI0021E3BCEE|nr:helix-turn-helix domain-containing protein [Geodermatophilus sp. YIM 151500]MCV2490563.1 helix-turn-helix domain-containing protein [Geodermatophilus sp. YIM 151500]